MFGSAEIQTAQVLTLNEQLSTRLSNSLIKQIQASDEMSWVAKIIDALPEKERLIIQLREIRTV